MPTMWKICLILTLIILFKTSERLKQRLVLYHGVMPIFMEFSDDAEDTFSRALRFLLVDFTYLCECTQLA